MNNGGAAFPVHPGITCDGQCGMTVRQFYKGQALAGLVGTDPRESPQLSNPDGRKYSDWIAADAAALADAMIAEDEAFAAREG